jgi:superfamily I DNA and RNA helicase
VDDITDLINEEGVLPEEILITFLWSYSEREELLNRLVDELEDQFDGSENIVNDVSHITRDDGSRGQVKKQGQISLSNIYHARGNEAPIVYVMGLDMVAEQTSKDITEGKERTWREQHIDIRNKAFVGLTRTQGWLKITGSDPGSRVVAEMNKVLQDTQSENPKLTLEIPSENSPFKDLETRGRKYE